MTCRIDNKQIERIEAAIPINRVAALVYEWARLSGKFSKDIDEATRSATAKATNLIEYQPPTKRAADNFIQLMVDYGLLEKTERKGVAVYKAIYPDLVEAIVENKRSKLNVEYKLGDWDVFGSINNLFLRKNKKENVKESYSVSQKQYEVGDYQLGVTLLSKSGIVNPIQTNETVDMIAEEISRLVIENGSITKEELSSIFDGRYNQFVDLYNKFKNAGNIQKATNIKEYIKNWGNLESMIIHALKRRTGLNIKGGITKSDMINSSTMDFEEVSENAGVDMEMGGREMTNFSDDFSITLNSKDTLSTRLKMFLSFIQKGPESKHYLLGTPLYVKFDEAFNTLSALLAGCEPVYDDTSFDVRYGMKSRLLEYTKIYPWINNVIQRLDEVAKEEPMILKEFVVAMNKHYIEMDFIMHGESADGYQARVWDDNSNAINRIVMSNFREDFMNSPAVKYDENGNPFYNKEHLKLFFDRLDFIFNNPAEETKDNLNNLMKMIGLNLSDGFFNDIFSEDKNTGVKYSGKIFKVKSKSNRFLSQRNDSPIGNIRDKIKAILKEKEDVPVNDTTGKKFNWFEDSSFKSIATLEGKHARHILSTSHRSGSKTIWSYTNDKYIVDRYNELMSGVERGDWSKIDELMTDAYSGGSWWLNMINSYREDSSSLFPNIFKFTYLSKNPLKEKGGDITDRDLTKMSPKELLLIKIALFNNNNKQFKDGRVGKFFYPTLSDKSNMLVFQSVLKDNIKYETSDKGTKSVDDNTVDFILDNIVSCEITRMHAIQNATNNYENSLNIEGYDEGSKLFYSIPTLNGIDSLFVATDTGHRILRKDLTEADYDVIRDAIKESVNKMIEDQITELEDSGIGYNEDVVKYIDSEALDNIGKNTTDKSPKNLSDLMAADFAVNSFIANMNLFQLFIGDPALYYKQSKDFLPHFKAADNATQDDIKAKKALGHLILKDTFDNVVKRLAGDMAPGYEAEYDNKKTLKVSISKDHKETSRSISYIEEIFKDHPNGKNIIDSYKGVNATDAQSWCSIDFFLDTLYSFGSKYITSKDYFEMKNEVTDAKKHNRDPKFTKSQLDVILQPIKPVYVNNVQKDIGDGKSIGVRTYIKISSFPLIPQLVENTDLYEVMKHMNSNGIDLHVFESGIKVGAPSLVVDNDGKELKRDKLSIFNKDGSIDMNGVSLMSANSLILPIKGWKIQQEVPYHEHPGTVNKITQAAKSLFNNIRDVKGFKYDGKTHDGFGLEDIYNKIYEKIHQRELAKLKDELYQKDSDGMPISIDTEKLSKILQEEAISKGYTLNDQIGLFLDEGGRDFRFPLWSLPSAHKYESLIISLVDNRTRKLKFPGNSFVLGSEAGFKFKKFTDSKDDLKAVLEKYKNKIIFTSNFDHSSGELQNYRPDANDKSKMRGSQVFISSKFKDAHGHFVDLTKYVKTDENTGRLIIDEERFPLEYLRLMGFRIPNQGHNSMAQIEIAGFLPAECGDLVIASQDFTVQMGSDKR